MPWHSFLRSDEYLARNPPFDVVVLDIRMPGIDGREVAKLIREMNRHQRIIFVTAYSSSATDDSASHRPADLEVITKPIDLEVLLKMIEWRKDPFLSPWRA